MTTLLQLNNSLFGDNGQSSKLADRFVSQWLERDPEARVIRRDLAASPTPHLNLTRFQAGLTPAAERSTEQGQDAQTGDTLIAEFMEADILVIGAPIYNFNVASTLKAWFDHVARAGTTFRYTEQGPEGLLGGRRAYVFVTGGGQHAGTGTDFQTPYIKHFLGFLGIDDVTFTYAEGLAMGEDVSREALASAGRRIAQLVA